MKVLIDTQGFSFKLATVIAVMVLMCGCGANRDSGANNDVTQNNIQYTILNSTLRKEVEKYDERFGEHPSARGLGLYISCELYTADSVIYYIGYSTGGDVNDEPVPPMLECEPVGGKRVVMLLPFLKNEVSMSRREAHEFYTKISAPDDYDACIESLDDYIILDHDTIYGASLDDYVVIEYDTVYSRLVILFDFVSLRLTFDRNHNLLQRDTLGMY